MIGPTTARSGARDMATRKSTVDNTEWMMRGSCCESDPDLWHDQDTVAQAVKICRGCPVLQQCHEWATHNPMRGCVIAGDLRA